MGHQPRPRRRPGDRPTAFDVCVIAVAVATVGLIAFAVGNAATSKIVADVTATVTALHYVPPRTEITTRQVPITRTTTDSKGNRTTTTVGYTTRTDSDYHPAEFHVIWRYEDLTLNQACGPDYCGRQKGDTAPMVIREGGWAHNHYLAWE
jgi:hypothetical protein